MSPRLLPPWLRLCSGLGLLAAGAGADAPKTHVLYLGADLAVQWRGELRPVQDAEANSFVLGVDGRRVTVPEFSANIQVRLESALKLSPLSATLDRVRGGPAYTEENNPHRGVEQAVGHAQDAAAVADLAAADLREQERAATRDRPDGSLNPQFKESYERAKQRYDDSIHALSQDINAPDQPVGRPVAASSGSQDAFSLSFDLSAPKPLARPYLVVAVRYLVPGEAAAGPRIAIFTQALPRTDGKPRRVHFFRGGFPPGYQLQRYQVHLYDGPREIPTTASAKRVELTAEEAFQYALAAHLADLRSATQPPLPARDFWPADLAARLGEENRNRLVFIRVDREGRPAGVFHDAESRLPVTDADITALLPELRFLPALEKGKPVAGVCRVNLGEQAL